MGRWRNEVDRLISEVDNMDMTQATDDIVRQHERYSEAFRRDLEEDPEKAKAFLVRAGILERCSDSRNGVRLAKRFRPAD